MSTGWGNPNKKRPRPDDDSDDDDDRMDVDEPPPHAGESVPNQVITIETRLPSSNKGFALLSKMGWTEGHGLGLSGEGRVDPVPFEFKSDSIGLGLLAQDYRMIETTVAQRRELDSERQQKESEEQKNARQEANDRRTALESQISDILKPFYCSLCDKQFKTVARYDEHTNSYAHHHKARFRDMQANLRVTPQEEIDKRKEKERRREEREIRKIAAANGIKMPKSLAPAAPEPMDAPPPPPPPPPDAMIPPPPPPPPPPGDSVATASPPIERSSWQKFQMTNSKRAVR